MTRILALSDMHTGDTTSVMPDVVRDGNNIYTSNELQKHLMDEWEKMCEIVGKVDAVIVNGDIAEGKRKNESSHYFWTNDLLLQCNVAVELLKMINTKRYYVTQGSFWHTEYNISSDRLVAEKLKGFFGIDLKINLKHARKSIHVAHKISVSTSGWMYLTTPIAKEMMLLKLHEDEYGKIDLVIRGHRHYFISVRTASMLGLTLPSWKGRDVYARTKTIGLTPNLGYVIFDIDRKGVAMTHDVFTLDTKDLLDVVEI